MTQHNAQSTSEPTISENDLIAQRHAKLKQIQEQAQAKGTSPWPNTFKREHYAEDLQAQFAEISKEEILHELQNRMQKQLNSINENLVKNNKVISYKNPLN